MLWYLSATVLTLKQRYDKTIFQYQFKLFQALYNMQCIQKYLFSITGIHLPVLGHRSEILSACYDTEASYLKFRLVIAFNNIYHLITKLFKYAKFFKFIRFSDSSSMKKEGGLMRGKAVLK